MPSSPPAASSTGPPSATRSAGISSVTRRVGAVDRHIVDHRQAGHRRGIGIGAEGQGQGSHAWLQRQRDLHRVGGCLEAQRGQVSRGVAPCRPCRGQYAAGQHQRVAVLRRQRLVRGDHQILLPQDTADVPIGTDADRGQHRCRERDLGGDRIRQLGKCGGRPGGHSLVFRGHGVARLVARCRSNVNRLSHADQGNRMTRYLSLRVPAGWQWPTRPGRNRGFAPVVLRRSRVTPRPPAQAVDFWHDYSSASI